MKDTAVHVNDNQLQERNRPEIVSFRSIQDSTSANRLIKRVEQAIESGQYSIVIDMSKTPRLKPNGLKALVDINSLMLSTRKAKRSKRGRKRRTPIFSQQLCVKLLNPSPAVKKVLDDAGATGFTDVYSDL